MDKGARAVGGGQDGGAGRGARPPTFSPALPHRCPRPAAPPAGEQPKGEGGNRRAGCGRRTREGEATGGRGEKVRWCVGSGRRWVRVNTVVGEVCVVREPIAVREAEEGGRVPELCRRCSGARRVGEGGQPSARPPLPVPLCVFPSALLCNGAAPGSGTHCHREPGAFWGCSVRTMGAKVPRRGLRAPRFLPRLWNAFAVCPAFSSSLCSAGLQPAARALPHSGQHAASLLQ